MIKWHNSLPCDFHQEGPDIKTSVMAHIHVWYSCSAVGASICSFAMQRAGHTHEVCGVCAWVSPQQV